MIAIRYALVFATPILAAILLFYGTLPLRTEGLLMSARFIDLAMTSNAEAISEYLASAEHRKAHRIHQRLDHLAIGTILAAGGASALLVRPDDSIKRKVDLMTTMVVGLGFAHLTIKFGDLPWPEFACWVFGSLFVAVCVIWWVTRRAAHDCKMR